MYQHYDSAVMSNLITLTFSIRGSTHVHHMNESIGMTQIVQELVAESATLMRTWHKTGNV
jgi:hypothetical protein